jgi:hypothetical protein
MKKNPLRFISIVLLVAIAIVYRATTEQTKIETETDKLREKHATFLKNHSFNKTTDLSKKKRRMQGLPPNAYFEQEYLNEIDPNTGRNNKRELLQLQEQLNSERSAQRAPGDATDNAWVERGPDNVGGRTRVVLFDPNDATQETVYAGGVSGGLWKNTDISNADSAWIQVGISENLSVSSIAVDPNNSNIWYVGTGESYTGGYAVGNGLWKTTNGGASWNHVFGGVTDETYTVPEAKLKINSPAAITGEYSYSITTAFGGSLDTVITGGFVLADDATDPTNDACSELTNAASMNGKIAILRRGTCLFDDKVKRAEDAGAIAVIVINSAASGTISMGGDGLGFNTEKNELNITLPSAMISLEDGNAFIEQLGSGVNGTLQPAPKTAGYNITPGIQHINDVIVRNNDGVSEVFFAAADTFSSGSILGVSEIGIYKSIDGTNFEKLEFPEIEDGSSYEPNDIEIATNNSIYVSTKSNIFGAGGGKIFQSTDGNTFTLVHTVPKGARTEIAASKSDANTLYVLAELNKEPVGIYKTTDNFATVTTLNLPNDADKGIPENDFTRGQAFYNLLLRVDPNDDAIVYVGGIDLFKSEDSGSSWNQISKWSKNNNLRGLDVSIVHADQHGMAFSSSSKMVFSNDGGVYFSDDAGIVISPRKKGYNTLQFYTVGVAPTTTFAGDEYFLAGAQDNGTLLISNADVGVNSFKETQGGDGAYSFFDQDGSDQYYIANYVYNRRIKLFDVLTNTSRIINSENEYNGDFINQEALDSNLDILYSNYSNGITNYIVRMYRNIKSGTVIKTDLSNPSLMDSEPSALTVSPHTTNQSNLFIGLKNGKLIKIVGITNTTPNNPVWSEISGPDFVGSVSDVEFGMNENEIFVTMHNYGVENIWYTSDGGNNWSAKQGNLPDIPVKAILQNPLKLEEVIIGTELGVWRTEDFFAVSPTWTQSYNGMSNVKVTDLDLRDDNVVFAATYGRGIFSGEFKAGVVLKDNVAIDNKIFTVYPTISKGNFTVLAKSSLGKAKLNIFDINGKQVYTKSIDFKANEKQEISISVNAGIYMVNIIDKDNRRSTNKIVIE